MLIFYIKVFRTSLFPNPVVYLFQVWYDDRCWSKILCSTILNPVHDFKVKVRDLEFLYWICVLSFYNVYFCEVFDGLIHVWHGDRNWSKILYGTIPNPEGHRLRIFKKKFCDKCFTISFFLQSLQWILFSCGVTIEPCLKFYAVPSQSQCMTLKSRTQTLNFFVLNLYSVSYCKAFDWFESCLVWIDIRF